MSSITQRPLLFSTSARLPLVRGRDGVMTATFDAFRLAPVQRLAGVELPLFTLHVRLLGEAIKAGEGSLVVRIEPFAGVGAQHREPIKVLSGAPSLCTTDKRPRLVIVRRRRRALDPPLDE